MNRALRTGSILVAAILTVSSLSTYLISSTELQAGNGALDKPTPGKQEKKTAPAVNPVNVKLKAIIIKHIEFKDTPINKAVELISAKAKEFDTKKEGVAITLSVKNPENMKVTMSLDNVPLGNVLDAITRASGLKYKVDEKGVTIHQ